MYFFNEALDSIVVCSGNYIFKEVKRHLNMYKRLFFMYELSKSTY